VCHLKSVPFRVVNCSDAAGKQFGYSWMMAKAKKSFTGTLWDNIAQSPYATYKVKYWDFFYPSLAFGYFSIYYIDIIVPTMAQL